MKTIKDMIFELTGQNIKQADIYEYLVYNELDLKYANLEYANLRYADLSFIKLTKQQAIEIKERLENGEFE